MQLTLVALLDADLADVVGASIDGKLITFLELLQIAFVDAANVAYDVGKELGVRVLAKQTRVDIDPGKAVAIRRKAGDFLLGKSGAYRQALEVLAFLEQFFETAPVAGRNVDDRGELIDELLQVTRLARRYLQRVGGIVVGEDRAIAVGDDPAVRDDRHNGYAVRLGQRVKMLVLEDLKVGEPDREQPEHEQHERRRGREAQPEPMDLELGVAQFYGKRHDSAMTSLCSKRGLLGIHLRTLRHVQ